MSIMDGYHAVTLTLDNNDPAKPKVYWSDQLQSSGGWKAYDKEGLDARLEDRVPAWWDSLLEDKNVHAAAVVRVWRLRSKPSS